MEKREEDTHERLKQKLSELEKEWTAMKTSKSSSAVSWITVEEAIEFVENSPRRLMLSLQRDQACPEAEMIQGRSPCRRRLFHDSDDDDETETISLSHSSCWSSSVMGDDNKKKKKKKKRRGIVSVSIMMLLLLLVLVASMDGFDHHSTNTQINTLVPT